MDLIAPWVDSIEIIALRPVKQLLGDNPMVLSVPRTEYFDIIALQIVKRFARDETN